MTRTKREHDRPIDSQITARPSRETAEPRSGRRIRPGLGVA